MVSFSFIASTVLALASTQVAAAPSLQTRQAPQGIAVLYGECTETGGTNGQPIATFAGVPACTKLTFSGINVALASSGCSSYVYNSTDCTTGGTAVPVGAGSGPGLGGCFPVVGSNSYNVVCT